MNSQSVFRAAYEHHETNVQTNPKILDKFVEVKRRIIIIKKKRRRSIGG